MYIAHTTPIIINEGIWADLNQEMKILYKLKTKRGGEGVEKRRSQGGSNLYQELKILYTLKKGDGRFEPRIEDILQFKKMGRGEGAGKGDLNQQPSQVKRTYPPKTGVIIY